MKKKKNPKPKKIPELVPKKTNPRIFLLKAMPYKGNMVYLRRIPQVDGELIMYDLVFKDQIYSFDMLFTPREGKKKLAKWEIAEAAAFIFTGAITTIDTLLGVKLDKKTKGMVKAFESAREKVVH